MVRRRALRLFCFLKKLSGVRTLTMFCLAKNDHRWVTFIFLKTINSDARSCPDELPGESTAQPATHSNALGKCGAENAKCADRSYSTSVQVGPTETRSNTSRSIERAPGPSVDPQEILCTRSIGPVVSSMTPKVLMGLRSEVNNFEK